MEQEILDQIVELRHDLHKHAELSLQEIYTKKKLMDFVGEHTSLTVVDKGKWFYAVKKCGAPLKAPIAFRADFDAVPIKETCDIPYQSITDGVGHKCGHDGHSSVLAGLAMELENEILDRDCYFIFQHGEEIGQGGEECAQLIKDVGISEIYAFHNRSGFPKNSLVYRRGLTQCASKGLTIAMTGKPAHASQPEDGINPAVPIARLVQFTEDVLKEHQFEEMVLCTIVEVLVGSKNFGVAASKGEVSMTLRANREEELLAFETLVVNCAKELAQENNLEWEYRVSDPFPETRNHDEAIDKILDVASDMGLELIEMEEPWRASEDFGYYTKQCSGAMVYVGNGEAYPMVHTSDYDFCDEIIPTCISLFKELAMKK